MTAATETPTETTTVQYKPDTANILKTGKVYKIIVTRKRLENARWLGASGEPVERLAIGQQVTLTADAFGMAEGTKAVFKVLCPARGSADDPVFELPAEVKGAKMEATWTNKGDDKSVPLHEYSFLCTAANKSTRSGSLLFTESIDLELEDDGKPCPNVPFVLVLADGKEHKGNLDAEGKAQVEDIPAGQCRVRFDYEGNIELAS